MIEVFNILKQITNYDQEPEIGGTPRNSDVAKIWRADNFRIRSLLGWKPKIDLITGLTKTVDWVRDNLSLYAGGE